MSLSPEENAKMVAAARTELAQLMAGKNPKVSLLDKAENTAKSAASTAWKYAKWGALAGGAATLAAGFMAYSGVSAMGSIPFVGNGLKLLIGGYAANEMVGAGSVAGGLKNVFLDMGKVMLPTAGIIMGTSVAAATALGATVGAIGADGKRVEAEARAKRIQELRAYLAHAHPQPGPRPMQNRLYSFAEDSLQPPFTPGGHPMGPQGRGPVT